jgi:hypothetical protein
MGHDPERSFLIRMLFEEYAKGSRSVSGDLVCKPAAQRKKPEF